MTEEELRDCIAMLRGITGASPDECYRFADAMLIARKADPEMEEGIVAIKKRKYERKSKE